MHGFIREQIERWHTNITTDTDIDAAVTAVTTATATINVAAEQGDPEGARTVKNTYNLQAGDNGEIVVGNEALMFYDNGGGDCYIVSVGSYKTSGASVLRDEIKTGVQAVAKVDEPTILLFPDGPAADYFADSSP